MDAFEKWLTKKEQDVEDYTWRLSELEAKFVLDNYRRLKSGGKLK